MSAQDFMPLIAQYTIGFLSTILLILLSWGLSVGIAYLNHHYKSSYALLLVKAAQEKIPDSSDAKYAFVAEALAAKFKIPEPEIETLIKAAVWEIKNVDTSTGVTQLAPLALQVAPSPVTVNVAPTPSTDTTTTTTAQAS